MDLFEKHTYRVSKVFNAPLKFVYDWCTDFREDDNKITASKTERRVLQKTKQRVIYISTYRRKRRLKNGVNIVTLRPPKAWDLDYVGEEEDEKGAYRLTALGAKKTRLDMTFRESYKIRGAPTKEEDAKHANEIWNKYAAGLERDYARRK